MKHNKKTDKKQSKNGHTEDKKSAKKIYYKHEGYERRSTWATEKVIFLTVISWSVKAQRFPG